MQNHDLELDNLKQEKQNFAKLDKSLTPKRKKVVLSFVQKLEILDKLKLGGKTAEIAHEYNIGVTTVCDIRKHGDEKLLKYRKENILNLNRKSSKTSEFPLLDKALKLWVYQERTKQYQITDSIFQAKAVDFFQILYPNSKRLFKASQGYVYKFLNRFDMTLKNESSKMHATLSKDDAFILDLHELHYTPDQIYNATESGLLYSELPLNITENEKKVSLLLCCNASGKNRLPLVFVNKTSLENQEKLPVYFQHNPRGWMTMNIFEEWFQNEFVPKVRSYLFSIHQDQKALLLIDNCPSHPMRLESSDGKIKCLFIQSESSHNLAPMKQGPISYLKRKYRSNFLRAATCNDNITNFLKYHKDTIKETIYSLANIWEEMPENLLRVCWHNLKMNLNVSANNLHNIELSDMNEIKNNFNYLNRNSKNFTGNKNTIDVVINNWLSIDLDDPGYGFLSDEEILNEVESVNQETESFSLSNTSLDFPINRNALTSTQQQNSTVRILVFKGQPTKPKIIDSATAYIQCQELMEWLEAQENTKPEDLIFIQRVKELASGTYNIFTDQIPLSNSNNSFGGTISREKQPLLSKVQLNKNMNYIPLEINASSSPNHQIVYL